MNTPVARLLHIAECCRENVALDAGDGVWLAVAVEAFLSGAHSSLDAALGIPRRRGYQGLIRDSAMQARNATLRRCAATYYLGHGHTQQAMMMAAAASRYQAGAWRSDRARGQIPPGERGIYATLFKAGHTIPKWRRLADILNCSEMADLVATEPCETRTSSFGRTG